MRLLPFIFLLSLSLPATSTELVPTEVHGKRFHIPPGFQLEMVASAPLVNRPIHAAWDEQGRLYVTDSSGTNDKVEVQLEKKPHRILCLEDTDSDGKFDKQSVFADQMMFPEGALWLDGSLYVAAPPSIWKLTDTNGDGSADQRTEWFQGKTLTGCANDLHGPYLGPDGWIYWCKGAFAEQTYSRPGKKPWVTRAAHIFRRKPSGGPIEHVMTGGMDNPIKVVFTPGGERIFNTTFFQRPQGGKRDGLIHAIYGGVYGKQHDVIEHHPRTGEVMPVLVHMGAAAPSGLLRLHSNEFGKAYRDNVIVSLFNMHKLTRHVLTPHGSTFSTQDEDFVVCDDLNFHPTDILEDADGSLLIVDTGGWYKLCCPTSQLWKPDLLGAIYRLSRVDAHQVEDPRGLALAWNNVDADQLANRLTDPRPTVRNRARNVLGKAGAQGVPSIAKLLSPSADPNLSNPRIRRQALWSLTQIESPQARKAVREALADKEETVRQVALHSISLRRDAAALPELLQQLVNGTDHNRRAVAEALGRLGDSSACLPILQAASKPMDRALEHALTYALIEINHPEPCRQAFQDSNANTQKVALLALDQMEASDLTAEEALQFTSHQDANLRRIAWWLIDRHPDWIPQAVAVMEKQYNDSSLSSDQRQMLRERMARHARHPAMQSLVGRCLQERRLTNLQRLELLQAMASASLERVPEAWTEILAHCLASESPEVLANAVHTIERNSSQGTPEKLAQRLTQLGLQDSLPTTTRLQALAAARNHDPLPENGFQFLLTMLSTEQPIDQRSLAVDALSRATLNVEQLKRLALKIEVVSPLELQRLIQVFQKSTDPMVGEQLALSLENNQSTISVPPSLLLASLARFGKPLAERAEQIVENLRQTKPQLWDEIQAIQELLPTADVRRGQALFQSSKAACSTCHRVGYLGGEVGPDLAHIGRIRDVQDLLESILAPSASFVRSYEPVVIETVAGLTYTGILKDETPQELVLALDAQKTIRIPKGEVEERQPGEISIMPAGLNKQLTQQELADLIKFLTFD